MIYLLVYTTLSTFRCELLENGLVLSIKGTGVINQTVTQEKGSRSLIQRVIIEGADALDRLSFEGFGQMIEILLPNIMNYIGPACFQKCKKLRSIIIPEGIKELFDETFSYCYELNSIHIPKTLQKLSGGLVLYATSIKQYFVNEFNQNFSTDSTNSYLMNYNKTVLFKGPTNSDIVIPASVEIISTYYSYSFDIKSITFEPNSQLKKIQVNAFIYENIEELILPDGIQHIEAHFFHEKLKRLSVPDSVEYFNESAVKSIVNLEEIIFDNSSKVLKKVNGVVYDINQTVIFLIPKTVSYLEISEAITLISQAQIRSRNIEYASVEYGNDIYRSYNGIVYKDDFLSLYACPGGMKSAVVIDNCTSIIEGAFINTLVENVTLPDGLKYFGHNCFGSCEHLTKLNIPQNVESFNSWVFSGCSSWVFDCIFPSTLETMLHNTFDGVPTGNLDFSKCIKLKMLYHNLFQNSKLKSIILPPNLRVIDEFCFFGSSIQEIVIVESVETINSNAFSSCEQLSVIKFSSGSNLTTIQNSAFKNTIIKTIELPKKLRSISESTFDKCIELENITYEEGSVLSSIGFSIIYGCIKLKEFEILNTVTSIAEGAFSGAIGLQNFVTKDPKKFEAIDGVLFTDKGKTLYAFPAGRESGVISSSVRSIAGMAFRECSKLQSLSFEEGITQIGPYTFYLCLMLGNISLSSSLQTIEKNAFSGCSSLQNVYIKPESHIESLNTSLFENCTKLISLKINGLSKLKTIGSRCLFGCSALKDFAFPPSVQEVGESALEGCNKLRSISMNSVQKIGPKAFSKCKSMEYAFVGPNLISIGSMAFAECSLLVYMVVCVKDGKAFEGCIDCFLGIQSDVIFVSQEFAGDNLNGVNVLHVLDARCNIPTGQFSGERGFDNSLLNPLVGVSLLYDH